MKEENLFLLLLEFENSKGNSKDKDLYGLNSILKIANYIIKNWIRFYISG